VGDGAKRVTNSDISLCLPPLPTLTRLACCPIRLARVNSVSLLHARLRNRIAKGLRGPNFMPVTDWLTSAGSLGGCPCAGDPVSRSAGACSGGACLAAFSCPDGPSDLRLVIRRLSDLMAARALRTDKTPGYRIILARPAGASAGHDLEMAAVCTDGASFRIQFRCTVPDHAHEPVLPGGLAPKTVARARRRMAASDADLFVWGERRGRKEDGLVLHGLTRGGG
jgi:hypothetical protein